MATGEDMDVLKTAEEKKEMSNENNKCVILRKLMTTLDRTLDSGVVKGLCQNIAQRLGNYCADGTSFNAPMLDDFFEVDVIRHRVLVAVMADVNENVELPEELDCSVGAGTLLFALHEYQHRYHEDDDPLLVAGRSTLENRARNNMESCLGNDGWGYIQLAMSRAYQSALAGHGREMVYRLVEVRQALQDWLPAGYEKIFIDYK